MAERVLELGEGLEIWRIPLDELKEQDLNARSMTPAMMKRLTATIERDDRLESLPFCAAVGDDVEVVSGHHRTRAARAAGKKEVYGLVDVTGLTRDEIHAKQLAHNAIEGMDDASLLRQIYESIGDVDARLEAFIDPDALEMPAMTKIDIPHFDLSLEYRTMLFTFLPSQQDRFERAVTQLLAQADVDRDELVLIDRKLFELWQTVMRRVSKDHDARALSTILMKLVDAAAQVYDLDLGDSTDGDPDEWVSLADVIGSIVVPPDVADIIGQAVKAMIAKGDITQKARWRAIELWAADSLAGVHA
jgi:hypothetical protein